ncbi:unnamed protein product [Blepharisma stoltei]|uniref:Uncharacterized protein n=1 Tax=Blepharisma stoltei TaxID=1481888 RepID=A0AAU9J985_9CILI|nr:unnamed protein product [Blepharisma stoltei]
MEQPFYVKSDNFAPAQKKSINVAEAYDLEESSPFTSIFVNKDPKKINDPQEKNKEIFASPERPELTIADLEPPSTERNLLALAKSSRASDTFALSKTTDGSLLKSKLSVRFSDTDQSGQITPISIIEEKKSANSLDTIENTYDNLKQKETKHLEIARPHCPTCRCALELPEKQHENEKASLGVSERDIKYLSSLGSSSLLKSNYPGYLQFESPVIQKIQRPYSSPIKLDSQKTPRIYISPIYNPATSPSHIFRERLNRRILSFEKNSPNGYNLYRKTY